ncbi:MAG: replication-associated recombination protein A [Clostridia bacterium]|nr:replication-associated recombination protein A [Clostridia bacterium]
MNPLSDLIRPDSIDDIVGQQHLLSKGCALYSIISSGNIPNMIFYGPSGCGKTTLANIIAAKSDRKLYKLNATTASISDIKAVIEDCNMFTAPNGVLLYLDEIQYFNKRQQQSLLEFIENGKITLIASTTENPYFYIYNAILSRCTVFEFKSVAPDDIKIAVKRAIQKLNEKNNTELFLDDESLDYLSLACGGDVRKAINSIELLSIISQNGNEPVTLEHVKQCTQKSSMRYDRGGDAHYDILSAFQKSIRGSDENAALHYLARLIEADDLPSICRRLLVIASEDIGLAYPNAAVIVKACVDSAMMLGFPEARIPLAQAVILLATSPKSNSAICAVDAALDDVRRGKGALVPQTLKDSHYAGAKSLSNGIDYKYPHNFKNNYIQQQYLPDDLKNAVYYKYGDNKLERNTEEYWRKIKNDTER